MSKLPRVSGRQCAGVLAKAGFSVKRQEGSHMILRRDDTLGQVVVPDHQELDRGTLRAIIRQAGLSVEEFERLDEDMMHARLADGREIGVPLEWFPSVCDATQVQQENWRLAGRGVGIEWEDLDEDLSAQGMLAC